MDDGHGTAPSCVGKIPESHLLFAGDEFWPGSKEASVATGYLRLGSEPNMKTEQTRMDELDDIVSTTGAAFLGMTIGCARCHNHKFDPIPQKDYYRTVAVFAPIQPHETPLAGDEELTSYKAKVTRLDEQIKQLKSQLEKLLRVMRKDE